MNRRWFSPHLAAAAWGLAVARRGAATTYKIRVTFPLRSPLASVANEFIPAHKWRSTINRAAGIKGHRLQLVAEDSQDRRKASRDAQARRRRRRADITFIPTS